MIRKSGTGFPKRSCSNKEIERDDVSKKSYPALGRDATPRRNVRLEKADELDNMLINEVGRSNSPRAKGQDADEESISGNAAGRQHDACAGAGKDLRPEDFALGTVLASPAEVAGGLGGRGRKGFRRHHQVESVSGPAARQGVRPLRHG